jgi:hypothetical protein
MGNCCGSRRFPFSARIITKRCNTTSKDEDDDQSYYQAQAADNAAVAAAAASASLQSGAGQNHKRHNVDVIEHVNAKSSNKRSKQDSNTNHLGSPLSQSSDRQKHAGGRSSVSATAHAQHPHSIPPNHHNHAFDGAEYLHPNARQQDLLSNVSSAGDAARKQSSNSCSYKLPGIYKGLKSR